MINKKKKYNKINNSITYFSLVFAIIVICVFTICIFKILRSDPSCTLSDSIALWGTMAGSAFGALISLLIFSNSLDITKEQFNDQSRLQILPMIGIVGVSNTPISKKLFLSSLGIFEDYNKSKSYTDLTINIKNIGVGTATYVTLFAQREENLGHIQAGDNIIFTLNIQENLQTSLTLKLRFNDLHGREYEQDLTIDVDNNNYLPSLSLPKLK